MDTKDGEISSVNKSARSIVEEFCSETSAHGLGRVLPVKNRTRTIVWSILFIMTVALFSYQLHELICKYGNRPLTTLITVESKASLDFPEITVCNVNIIKNSSFYAYNYTGHEEGNCQYYRKNVSVDNGYDSEYWKEENMFACFAQLNKTSLAKMGHQFKDIVRSCTFKGKSCRKDASLWTSFWHYKFGNCFVFNVGEIMRAQVLRTNKPGMSNGLALEMNIEKQEYLGMSGGAGIKIDISNQGMMPFPLERGMSLAPGYATMVGLKKTVIKRIDPFEDGKRCKSEDKVNGNNLYTELLNTSYSLMSCRESCMATSQQKKCGCMEYRFPNDGLTEVCRLNNETQMKCIKDVQKTFDDKTLECAKSCVPPCRSVDFKVSTSFEAWPALMYENMPNASGTDFSDYDVRKNNLKLYVFYQELEEELIEERFSYKMESFCSDIGGQLGLWIGFSVLTLAEFVEFIMMLCHFAFRKCTKKNQVTLVTPST